MLLLMSHCIDTGKVSSKKEFAESLGLPASNLTAIKNGERSFTVSQITTAAKKYKVDVNWIVGISERMAYTGGKTALQLLKDATRAVEAELAGK